MTGPVRARAFDEMVSELRAHPLVEVVVDWRAGPMDAETRASLAHVPAEVLAFYEGCNGRALLWGRRGGRVPEAVATRTTMPRFSPEFETPGADVRGCFYMPPLEQVLLQDGWMREYCGPNDSVRIYGVVEPEKEFWSARRPFEMGDGYWEAGFLARPGAPLRVVMGDDQGACWTDSRVTTFDAYLESVVASYASRAFRGRNFILGSLQSECIGPPDGGWPRPTIDELLAMPADLVSGVTIG